LVAVQTENSPHELCLHSRTILYLKTS
jgi:hypothetical protein